jgi:hypothetical protein
MGRSGQKRSLPAPVNRSRSEHGAELAAGGTGERGFVVEVAGAATADAFRFLSRRAHHLTAARDRAAVFAAADDAVSAGRAACDRGRFDLFRVVDGDGQAVYQERRVDEDVVGLLGREIPDLPRREPAPEPVEPRLRRRVQPAQPNGSAHPLVPPIAKPRLAPREPGKWWNRLEKCGLLPDAKQRQASAFCQLLEAFGLMPVSGEQKERTLGRRVLVAVNFIPPASVRRRSRAWQVFARQAGYNPLVDAGDGGHLPLRDLLDAKVSLEARRGRTHKGTLARSCGHRETHSWRKPEQRLRLLSTACESCLETERAERLDKRVSQFERQRKLPPIQALSPLLEFEGRKARHDLFKRWDTELRRLRDSGADTGPLQAALQQLRSDGPLDAVFWIAAKQHNLDPLAYHARVIAAAPPAPVSGLGLLFGAGGFHDTSGFVARRKPQSPWHTGARPRRVAA